MAREKKLAKYLKKIKWVLLILLVPFISIFLIIQFRHVYMPTNEEIVESLINTKGYTTKAEYIIKNSRGEYKEETSMYYSKENGMRLEFGENRIKIYKNGIISIQENEYKYELNGDFDSLYPMGFVQNILGYEIEDIKEGSEEWGEIKYIEINVNIPSKNRHISRAKVYINKEDKAPIVTKIYDDENNERVIIKYKEFENLKEIDGKLFETSI